MSLSRIRKCEALPLLQLGHLTRLTELSSSSKPLVLQEGDVLPASLVVLRVRDCWASTPLLPLTRLEVGEMRHGVGSEMVAVLLGRVSVS